MERIDVELYLCGKVDLAPGIVKHYVGVADVLCNNNP